MYCWGQGDAMVGNVAKGLLQYAKHTPQARDGFVHAAEFAKDLVPFL
jgi:hypothetical protein